MRIVWTKRASGQVSSAKKFIGANSPSAAAAQARLILAAIERLRAFPALGRIGRFAGTRELVVPRTPYVVIYRQENDEVLEILLVLHGAQQLPTSSGN